MNNVEKKYIVKSVNKYLIVLEWKDAVNFINECEIAKIAILGIDAFIVTSVSIQPVQEKGIDFTNKIYNHREINRYSIAREAIQNAGNKFCFEITCE